MKYRVRIIVESLALPHEHSETILGSVEADCVADVVRIASGFSFVKESATDQHERLVAAQGKPPKEKPSAKPVANEPA